MAATTSLDNIVRATLSKRGYSLHWYVQFLLYAREALRELSMDDLKCYNTQLLPITEYNAIDLPNDYLDYVTVGIPMGEGVRPLVENTKLNVLNNFDSDFAITDWTTPNSTEASEETLISYGAFPYSNWFTTRYNVYGENIGRMGSAIGGYSDTFVVARDRNQIQLNQQLKGFDYVYLQYASTGEESGAATTIDPYAQQTIQAYIDWQHKENNRTYSPSERMIAKQEYINQRGILRARKSDLTLNVLKRILQKNSFSAPR